MTHSDSLTRREILVLSTAAVAACALAAGAQDGKNDGPPKALVFDHADKWTNATGAEDQLRAAGFVVEKLPLDRSPYSLEADLIFLASFASESPDYKKYMTAYAKELYR